MERFYTASAIYLVGSLLLTAGVYAMGMQRRRIFGARFGPGREYGDLSETEDQDWIRLHDETFNHGFWRFIMLAFMFYHYPGFAACVTVLKGLLNTLVMVIVSAVFWIGLLYWVC
ncbi:MAG TPA: hypothetical protein DCP71_11740 [Verrucomicrobiales bacterium]|jgi:hypothetical protein|nr:hypothetical protein [Verrucomicrobiales bacterium]